jgi:signal transduction histidine kinase/CheY-like chemotaxis protein
MPETRFAESNTGVLPMLSVLLAHEPDVVTARQRARQLARLLGFDNQDQIRLATATSEIARNAFQYAGSGRVDFGVNLDVAAPVFIVQVVDRGPGISNVDAILQGQYRSRTGMGLGIAGTRRLMDHFSISSNSDRGTRVEFAKFIPSKNLRLADISRLTQELEREGARNPFEELQQQNQELLAALDSLRERELELDRRQTELNRLNQELQDTNSGVLALYTELDEKAAALRVANEIKSRFLSHMSHEFRTPLNSILALTKLLQRHTDGDLTSDQEKQVGYIRAAAEELFEMVNDLLDLAKVEAGKVEVKQDKVDVPQLFGALRGMLRPLATHEAVSLNIEEPAPGLTLMTDESKLSQILRNLVSNALKFTEHGEIRLSATASEGQVVFEASDTGIGIAPEHQQLIFQDFTQIDNPIQRRVKGTGLGLPLSRKLAELLGGSLTVQSVVGRGSVFTLSLPQGHSDSQSVATPKSATAEADTAGSILIIDDEEVSRYLIKQLFRGTRYRFIEAATGSEGAERARFEHPRLILLDLTMPGQNGFEVLEELKADPATASIPVVIHTSVTLRPEDVTRLGGRHAAVLPKQPAGREQAVALIRELLAEPYLFA